jgi:hypothetical protein
MQPQLAFDQLKDSRLRYRENATLLLEKAKALPPADLIALWQFLANDCSLVVISTPGRAGHCVDAGARTGAPLATPAG